MGKTKKLNKLKVGIVIFLVVSAFSIAVFGRYIYNNLWEAYFSARQFYFSSDILILGGTTYTYDGWGGIDEYEVGFDLYSYDNELSKLNYDLDYTVTCESLNPDKIECSIVGTEGETTLNGKILKEENNTSRVNILVKPKTTINVGETVRFKVIAKTEVPYKKEIFCTFSLYIKLPEGNSYTIEDVTGRDYALLKLVNRSGTATQATLEFDPNILRLDLNDEIYTNPDMFVEMETTRISGNDYINMITFNISKESSKNVKFYKLDKTQNYSYPGVQATSPITVDY